jgi:hypothetical protein
LYLNRHWMTNFRTIARSFADKPNSGETFIRPPSSRTGRKP